METNEVETLSQEIKISIAKNADSSAYNNEIRNLTRKERIMNELGKNEITKEQMEQIREKVKSEMKAESDKPLKVSVMGQTGVGKTSLLNALFNTKLKTDSVRPCTKEIEQVVVKGNTGHELWFYDLPGIGESESADQRYLSHYIEKLGESDVVLWGIHADSRSVSFDFDALNGILKNFDEEHQAQLMSKITFVLTKADTLSPPAWILAKLDNKNCMFAPSRFTQSILEQKSEYYQEVFLRPYGNLILSQTYNDCDFKIADDRFSYDDYAVFYRGFMDKECSKQLKLEYPQYGDVIDRLYDNYQVIPCSSLFRFNLSQLMLVIVNKLGRMAIKRFKNFVGDNVLNQVQLSDARKYCNIIVFDKKKNRKVFDLTEAEMDDDRRFFGLFKKAA